MRRRRRWEPPPPLPGGFTLVEVLVALVLLEVGLVATAGLLALAGRELTRARRVEAAVGETAAVVDSLLAEGSWGAGERKGSRLTVRWTGSAGSSVVVAEPADGGAPLVELVVP